jgi:glycosyltransferase involved in cell wall biosynthesis
MENIIDENYLKISKYSFNKFQLYIKNMCNQKAVGKYNILYVCDAQYLQRKMSRVRFWAIESLGKHKDVNLLLTGPGFLNFNNDNTLQQNILNFNIHFDRVIWYKPLNENYRFDKDAKLPFKTCLRYNEMWDVEWTRREIDESRTDVIICHHKNDYLRYKDLYKTDPRREFIYLPHFADPDIFKPLHTPKDIDILISGVIKETHYPLKNRLYHLIMKYKTTALNKYTIHVHTHPTYVNELSFENVNQINYNQIINRSKLCIACTSKHQYRLGKYVEIPMAGSVIVGDLPFEDEQFKQFVVEVNLSMTDEEIINIIRRTLENPAIIEQNKNIGLEWSSKYVTANYCENLLKSIAAPKIFIISDEIRDNHPEFKNQKWICDILKQEFMETFPNETTHKARCADIIWYLGPWNHKYTPNGFTRSEWLAYLKTKKVICTQHHVDPEKFDQGQLDVQFRFMREFGTYFHAICEHTKVEMKHHFDESKIFCKKLWVNNQIYYHIPGKDELRVKYNISKDAYLVGSFQKDTEGKTNLPKLSKGPDIFVNIIKDMHKTNANIEVVLTGLRREYIINELEKQGIRYHYFNMIPMEKMNELYNCLDLYLVSSRCEGGPRSVFEAGLTKTPIISTRVGISPELMDSAALFDCDNWMTYKDAIPATNILHQNVIELTSDKYMEEFKDALFS